MILPSKHAPLDKSTLGIAALILRDFTEAATVSQAWEQASRAGVATFDQFVSALDFLYLLNVIHYRNGRLVRA
jgi:hypothetical protein